MNILCFGDSNTHGYNPIDESRYDENNRWPKILQKLLTNDHYVIEEGLSGRTTVFDDPVNEGLSGIDYIIPCIKSHRFLDIVIVMLGTNDLKQRYGASASVISLGLSRLVKKIISEKESFTKSEPNILIITPPTIDANIKNVECYANMGEGCSEKSKQLAYYYEKVSQELGCMYMDASDYCEFSDVDYMHFDEENHHKLAKAIYESIIKKLG